MIPGDGTQFDLESVRLQAEFHEHVPEIPFAPVLISDLLGVFLCPLASLEKPPK